MKAFYLKYRKAFAAFIGTFLGTFPLVAYINGDHVGDIKTLFFQALGAGIAAGYVAITKANQPA